MKPLASRGLASERVQSEKRKVTQTRPAEEHHLRAGRKGEPAKQVTEEVG